MTRDQLEFSISQYADGTLPAWERAALEAVLARDAAARALLAEYRALDAALKAAPDAPPAVAWDRLAERIGGAVAQVAAREESGGPGVSEELEFAISRYADGTLDPADRPAVEAALASDPAARLVLNDYVAVDSLVERMASQSPPPAVRWEGLAARIAETVAGGQAGAPLSEESEFAVAQYADGTLPADQLDAVEASLDADASARFALADYARVDAALEQLKQEPLPAVRWDRLAEHLSAAVAEEAGEAEAARDEKADTRSYKLFAWARKPAWLAAAASVVIAVGVAMRLALTPGGSPRARVAEVDPKTPTTPTPPAVALAKVVITVGPQAEAAPKAEMSVAIGPPPAGVAGDAAAVGDDIVTRPSRVLIASSGGTPDEGEEDLSQPF